MRRMMHELSLQLQEGLLTHELKHYLAMILNALNAQKIIATNAVDSGVKSQN
jgi:hypothetical protein